MTPSAESIVELDRTGLNSYQPRGSHIHIIPRLEVDGGGPIHAILRRRASGVVGRRGVSLQWLRGAVLYRLYA